MAIFYRILQAIVIGALAVLLWFFIVGLGDGSIGASNMLLLLWLVLLAVPIAGLVFGMHLWSAGKRGAACLLLAAPAAPALVFGLFLALFVILQPDMR